MPRSQLNASLSLALGLNGRMIILECFRSYLDQYWSFLVIKNWLRVIIIWTWVLFVRLFSNKVSGAGILLLSGITPVLAQYNLSVCTVMDDLGWINCDTTLRLLGRQETCECQLLGVKWKCKCIDKSNKRIGMAQKTKALTFTNTNTLGLKPNTWRVTRMTTPLCVWRGLSTVL